jgi:hypothetical protein
VTYNKRGKNKPAYNDPLADALRPVIEAIVAMHGGLKELSSINNKLVKNNKWRTQRGKLRLAGDGFACDKRQLPRVIVAPKKAHYDGQGVAK